MLSLYSTNDNFEFVFSHFIQIFTKYSTSTLHDLLSRYYIYALFKGIKRPWKDEEVEATLHLPRYLTVYLVVFIRSKAIKEVSES